MGLLDDMRGAASRWYNAAMKTLDAHIELTPGIAGGKPRIAGHRITGQDVVIWNERLGKSIEEIAAEYDLSLAEKGRIPQRIKRCPWLRIELT